MNESFCLAGMFVMRKSQRQRSLRGCAAFSGTFALLCLVMGLAAYGNASSPDPGARPASAIHVSSQFAIADFDGDTRPDLATVQVGPGNSSNALYRIRFQLSSGPRQTIDVTAPSGGVALSSRDVNGDTFPDVIVTASLTNRPVAVLLNDGRGNFTASDPSVFPAAFATSDNSWNFRSDQIKDASVALVSRYSSGEYEERGRSLLPANEARLPISHSSDFAGLCAVVSFGRAPPFFAVPV
jgi:hypothetical protein